MKYDVTHRGIGMTSQRTRERLIQRLRDAGVKNSLVLEIIRNTPRHIFVDEALASRAYEDTALPIGNGQTLSQPYVVARMTEALLEHGTPERVLEIGAGSGYQTAILAQLVKHVFAVERLGALAGKARERLRDLGLYNIQLRHADGFWVGHSTPPMMQFWWRRRRTRSLVRCSRSWLWADASSSPSVAGRIRT